jgi:hypothetical protein
MRSLLHLPGALYELIRLGFITRLDFKGPYWAWRLGTAFGRGYPTSRRELAASILEYGRWIRRMRRGI